LAVAAVLQPVWRNWFPKEFLSAMSSANAAVIRFSEFETKRPRARGGLSSNVASPVGSFSLLIINAMATEQFLHTLGAGSQASGFAEFKARAHLRYFGVEPLLRRRHFWPPKDVLDCHINCPNEHCNDGPLFNKPINEINLLRQREIRRRREELTPKNSEGARGLNSETDACDGASRMEGIVRRHGVDMSRERTDRLGNVRERPPERAAVVSILKSG